MTGMSNVAEPLPKFDFFTSQVYAHHPIAKDTWQLTVPAPVSARRTLPGQFFMVRIAGTNDPLIGRALAMYDIQMATQETQPYLSVVYTVKGKFTRMLSTLSVGDAVELWGPLGNAFSDRAVDHLILVAGGVGQTPMLSLANAALGKRSFGLQHQTQPFAKRVSLCYGARSKNYLAGLSEFEAACSDVHIATEDGSLGIQGRVTDLLPSLLDGNTLGTRIACCGPEPMMEAVASLAQDYQIPCEVSLETPMACGIGICFTCVAKVYQSDGEWDYKRTCIEGPIFDAGKICWH